MPVYAAAQAPHADALTIPMPRVRAATAYATWSR
jgi:hypothetical protein